MISSFGVTRNTRSPRFANAFRPQIAGKDVKDASAEIDGQRLYSLGDLPEAGRHQLSLKLPSGVQGYAFTFG